MFRRIPFYGRYVNNQLIIDAAHTMRLSVVVYTIEVFFHTALVGGAFHIQNRVHVPTFGRVRIPLRRRRPREPSSRPPCRLSSGAGRGMWARWRKKQTKRFASSRENGRGGRRALVFLLVQRHDFAFQTYIKDINSCSAVSR